MNLRRQTEHLFLYRLVHSLELMIAYCPSHFAINSNKNQPLWGWRQRRERIGAAGMPHTLGTLPGMFEDSLLQLFNEDVGKLTIGQEDDGIRFKRPFFPADRV